MLTEYDDIVDKFYYDYSNIESIPYKDIFSSDEKTVEKFYNFVEALFFISNSFGNLEKESNIGSCAKIIEKMIASICLLKNEDDFIEDSSKIQYRKIINFLKNTNISIDKPIECIHKIFSDNIITTIKDNLYQKITGGIIFSSILNAKDIPMKYVYLLGLQEKNFSLTENYNSWNFTEIFHEKETNNNFSNILSMREIYHIAVLQIITNTKNRVVLSHCYTDQSIIQNPSIILTNLIEKVQSFEPEFTAYNVTDGNSHYSEILDISNLNFIQKHYKDFLYRYSYWKIISYFKNSIGFKEKYPLLLKKIYKSHDSNFKKVLSTVDDNNNSYHENNFSINKLLNFILLPFESIFTIPYEISYEKKMVESFDFSSSSISKIFFLYWKYIENLKTNQNDSAIEKFKNSFISNYIKQENIPDGVFFDIGFNRLQKVFDSCINILKESFSNYYDIFITYQKSFTLYKKLQFSNNTLFFKDEFPYYYIDNDTIHIIPIFFTKPTYLYKNSKKERKEIFYTLYILLIAQFLKYIKGNLYSTLVCHFFEYQDVKNNKGFTKEGFHKNSFSISLLDCNIDLLLYFLEKYCNKETFYLDIDSIYYQRNLENFLNPNYYPHDNFHKKLIGIIIEKNENTIKEIYRKEKDKIFQWIQNGKVNIF